MKRALIIAICGAVLGATASSASAQHGPLHINERYYEIGPVFFEGGVGFPGDAGDPMRASGIRVYERNGLGGKIVATAIVATMLAMGRSDKEYLGSSYGYGYRVDYYRQKSASEMAAEDAARAAAVDATAKSEYQMDLQVFFPNGDAESTATGWSWTLMFATIVSDDKTSVFEIGMLWARIKDQGFVPFSDEVMNVDGVDSERRLYHNFGTPLRYVHHVKPFGWFDIQWDLNWLALAEDESGLSHNSPIRTSFTLNPLQGRFYLRGGAVFKGFTAEDLGYQVELGFRI